MSGYSGPPSRYDTDVVGKRVLAQIVDLVLSFGLLVGTMVLVGTGLGRPAPEAVFVVSPPVLVLYGGLLEGYWNGQTVGKRAVGIRVVDETGEPITVQQAFVRNVPAVVIPGWLAYLVALASMASTERRQRLFDLLARTVVVDA